MSELAGARGIDGWFAPKRVTELFEAFHLDSPGNVSRDLARLRKAGLITRRGAKPNWSVSPEGHERVKELVGEVDASD
ncbi:MAG: helix-turn-helix domain-containing protein, partial [Alphaproteobacteria bacterium]